MKSFNNSFGRHFKLGALGLLTALGILASIVAPAAATGYLSDHECDQYYDALHKTEMENYYDRCGAECASDDSEAEDRCIDDQYARLAWILQDLERNRANCKAANAD